VLSAHKFNGRKVLEKIIVGGLFLIFAFQQPTLIFSKTFLPLNQHANKTKLLQKTDWKKVDTSEIMAEKQFLTNPLGKWRYLEPKWKNFFHNFPHFQHKQNAKEILRKISFEPKLQLIKNYWPFWTSDAILNRTKNFSSLNYAVYDH
jgi:hypothetical protein